ncbi:MAG: hypothetical protein FWG98_01610 [Candidatus Cloacimonetes bacterium]|nr:hypothetical protein [Candidatus Cloacimonadota bacterium]
MKLIKHIYLLLFFIYPFFLFSVDVNFQVRDYPNDDGRRLLITYDESVLQAESVLIYRSFDGEEYEFWLENPESNTLIDEFDDFIKNPVHYRLVLMPVLDDINQIPYALDFADSATPKAQWFNRSRIPLLLLLILFCGTIVYYITLSGKGKEFYIRKINGLEAMDEAVGRATEMGRPILFVPGISDISDMQTIAALTILGKLAEKVAEYHSKIIVPCRNSLVMAAARDIVKESYLKAGSADEFNADHIFYLTDDQFGYVAGIDGIMIREKPATNFFLGGFWAESLILAETGFSIGAIQISGTANAAQIPFFVAACDYTLIGEELFAASAYLSNNPQQIGSLKGQDFGKIVVIVLIVLGVLLEMCGITAFKAFFTG